ncbi:hypothetical protein GCM10011533_30250 [Streptosporangium jomthongense]|uniref:Uncharacterized protein n=1 Tax=Marinobacter aromaticivorans TaxID=1494078 RepID=A0ABW2IYT4_9GAMM|nr:hypothetical protein [Marinobacter aromaticivorans]GGE75851.1 hypothetical protein GCM10011533_30250 [Streptosporangium jomthongense]
MRPEHIAANRLIDIALTGNRQAYKTELNKIRAGSSDVAYDNITRMAARQFKMQTQDCRYFSWRAEWVNERKQRAVNE